MKLWSLLGFAPAKAEFKNHLISLDDFLLVLNNKKSTGQLGRDDVDGRCTSGTEPTPLPPAHSCSYRVTQPAGGC